MPKVSVDLSYFNNHLTTPWYFDVSPLSLPLPKSPPKYPIQLLNPFQSGKFPTLIQLIFIDQPMARFAPIIHNNTLNNFILSISPVKQIFSSAYFDCFGRIIICRNIYFVICCKRSLPKNNSKVRIFNPTRIRKFMRLSFHISIENYSSFFPQIARNVRMMAVEPLNYPNPDQWPSFWYIKAPVPIIQTATRKPRVYHTDLEILNAKWIINLLYNIFYIEKHCPKDSPLFNIMITHVNYTCFFPSNQSFS
jgi:hypothetical protein